MNLFVKYSYKYLNYIRLYNTKEAYLDNVKSIIQKCFLQLCDPG